MTRPFCDGDRVSWPEDDSDIGSGGRPVFFSSRSSMDPDLNTPNARLREALAAAGENISVSVVLAALDEQGRLDDEQLARMTRIREAHYTDDDGHWCLKIVNGFTEDLAMMLLGIMQDAPNYTEIMVKGTDATIEGSVGTLRFSVVYLRPGAPSVGELHRREKARADRLESERDSFADMLAEAKDLLDEQEKEILRLRDLLDCETGTRAPGGWAYDSGEWTDGVHVVQRVYCGPMFSWSYLTLGWTTGKYFDHALEAIEASMKERT
jgi:hypothetical protein